MLLSRYNQQTPSITSFLLWPVQEASMTRKFSCSCSCFFFFQAGPSCFSTGITCFIIQRSPVGCLPVATNSLNQPADRFRYDQTETYRMTNFLVFFAVSHVSASIMCRRRPSRDPIGTNISIDAFSDAPNRNFKSSNGRFIFYGPPLLCWSPSFRRGDYLSVGKNTTKRGRRKHRSFLLILVTSWMEFILLLRSSLLHDLLGVARRKIAKRGRWIIGGFFLSSYHHGRNLYCFVELVGFSWIHFPQILHRQIFVYTR